MIVENSSGSRERKNSSSTILDDLDIPKNPHGDWFVVARKVRKPRRGNKGKAKVKDSILNGPILGNRFEKLINEIVNEGDDTMCKDAEIPSDMISVDKLHEDLEGSCGKHKETKWQLINVKKKVKSPSMVSLKNGDKNERKGASLDEVDGPKSVFGRMLEKGSSSGSKIRKLVS